MDDVSEATESKGVSMGVRVDRRGLLQSAAAAVALLPLAGCKSSRPKSAASAGSETSGSAASQLATTAPSTTEPSTAGASSAASPSAPAVKIPGPPWEGGTRGGNAVALWGDSTLTYDPPLAYGRADYYGLANVYRGLAFYGPGAEPQLDMAESLDISPDGKTYTFVLKPNLKFHHGRTVTAADFKWTFERSSSKKLASWVQGFLGSVEGHADFVADKAKTISGIVAKDDLTLILTLTKPDVTILGVVGIPPFYVLPREEVERLGEKFSENPVGAGPYKLKSWDSSKRTINFERFADYQYAEHLPYLDTLQYQWGVTDDVSYLKVSRDEADLTLTVPPSALQRIRNDEKQKARLQEWDSFTILWWEFDVSTAPFNDKRVRKAVNHAFNRERTRVFGNNPTGHFLPPKLLGFDEAAFTYDYDPKKARALLAEAGVRDLSFTLPVLDANPGNSRIAQLLQEDLRAVGITVKLEQVKQTPYDLGEQLPKKYRMWNMGWGMGLPDPSELTASLIGSKAPSNYGGYANPSIDETALAALGETDREKRGALYAQIEKTLIDDAAFLFLGIDSTPSFTSSTLKNFSWEPVLWTYWDRMWKA